MRNRVTGHGSVEVDGESASFWFSVEQRTVGGRVTGWLYYRNRASGVRLWSGEFASLEISDDTATFAGTCINHGAPCSFTVTVTESQGRDDNGTFRISISGSEMEGGPLRKGRIQIHR